MAASNRRAASSNSAIWWSRSANSTPRSKSASAWSRWTSAQTAARAATYAFLVRSFPASFAGKSRKKSTYALRSRSSSLPSSAGSGVGSGIGGALRRGPSGVGGFLPFPFPPRGIEGRPPVRPGGRRAVVGPVGAHHRGPGHRHLLVVQGAVGCPRGGHELRVVPLHPVQAVPVGPEIRQHPEHPLLHQVVVLPGGVGVHEMAEVLDLLHQLLAGAHRVASRVRGPTWGGASASPITVSAECRDHRDTCSSPPASGSHRRGALQDAGYQPLRGASRPDASA